MSNDGADAASSPDSMPASDATPARRRVPVWIAPLVVLVVIALDQLTKAWAVATLEVGVPEPVIGDFLEWRLSYNTGSAFSLFTGFTPVLAILAAVIAIVLIRVVMKATDVLLVVALSMVLGGALGNLIDRVARAEGFLDGGVVDFINVTRWPTFNIADSAITIGAALLVYWGWKRPDTPKAAKGTSADEVDVAEPDPTDRPHTTDHTDPEATA